MKIAVLTGGFDPVTAGHLSMFSEARKKADIVIVFANSDAWLTRKKGKSFMDQDHRLQILNAIEHIDRALPLHASEDADDTSCEAINIVRKMYPNEHIYFMNGGDRGKDNIPEMSVDVDNVEFVFGVGGTNKDYSSSWLLREWKEDLTKRRWGFYKVLSDDDVCKVKELYIEPGKSISLQEHARREEHWIVVQGEAMAQVGPRSSGDQLREIFLTPGSDLKIYKNQLHKLTNCGTDMLMVVEVQTGDYFGEDDIIRYEEIDEETQV